MSAVAYLYPNGALAPTQAQMDKFAYVHAIVTLDGAAPVDLVHNMQFDLAAPPEALQQALVHLVPISGAVGASVPAVTVKDGNTLTFSTLGPNAVTVDVWVSRHHKASGFWG